MIHKKLFLLSLFLLAGCVSSAFVESLPTLKGKTMDKIRSKFGQPTIIHNEESTQLWTYHKEDCICLIFFDKNKIVQYAETRGACSDNIVKE